MARTKHIYNRPYAEVEVPPPTVAYLANSFPSPVEPYVGEEIAELRRRGIRVVPCSIWRAASSGKRDSVTVLTVANFQPWLMLCALWICVARFAELHDFFHRIFLAGSEPLPLRMRALAHTWLGAKLALQLRDHNIRQISVHHGFMAAWVGMVAARLLKIPYGLTLHGSDLLLQPTFLDIKLQNCALCLTVSDFNRRYLLEHFPHMSPERVLVHYMGVQFPPVPPALPTTDARFNLLAVGRLHTVKDHAFLIRACASLKTSGMSIFCRIAGAGPERRNLDRLICSLHLGHEVQLLGHVNHEELAELYGKADLVVLTSVSEGIPLALMEAMALGRLVLAPAITGIPELVLDGQTGFLYRPGSISDFVERVEFVRRSRSSLGYVGQAAREHVNLNFNLTKTLRRFGDMFMQQQIPVPEEALLANPLLQQIQL